MENKRKNVYVVLFVITTIIAGCLAAYFGIMKNKEAEELNNQIASLKDEISTLKQNNSVDVQNEQEQVNNNVEKNVIFNLDISNCLNLKDNNIVYDSLQCTASSSDSLGISCNITKDMKTVNLVLERNTFNNRFLGTEKQDLVKEEEYKIDNFDTQVIDVSLASYSQAVGDELLLFLMKDGTIEYLPLRKAAQTNNFKSYGKIENIKDVVRIYTARCYSADPNVSGNARTIVAFTNEGKFYDLGDILNNLAN